MGNGKEYYLEYINNNDMEKKFVVFIYYVVHCIVYIL